jgi:hypothetical protein
MRRDNDGLVVFAGMSILFVIGGAFALFLLWLKIWLFASLITSGVKVIKEDCGKHYGVENYIAISGNWFCEDK